MTTQAGPVREVLVAVAAHGLPGAATGFPSRPLEPGAWSDLLAQVEQQRIPGLLLSAVDEGALPATDAQAAEAADRHLQSMRLALRLERLLIEVIERLAAAGVESRALKGSALAHLDYPDPALRSFGDIDVLVPADRYDRAVAVLQKAGAVKRFDEPRPGFDRRFGKGAELRTQDGFEVDLHRTFVSGPFGLTVRLTDLFESGTPFEVGGRTLVALSPEHRFLHACFHAALGTRPPRLAPLRDIAQLALYGNLDFDLVMDVTEAWKVPAVTAAGVRLAWGVLGLSDIIPVSVWARSFVPDAGERRALSVYMDSRQASYPAQAVAAVRAIPGWSDRAAYLRAMVLPERSYVRPRDGGYLRRLARGARYLRGGAG